jgi:hypothetical protein
VNSPPPKPEVILTNFFAEPTVLLVPITSRDSAVLKTVRAPLCTASFSKQVTVETCNWMKHDDD